jgi:hypothetical protein
MVVIKDIKRNDIIQIKEEGDYFDEIGVVIECNKERAALMTVQHAEYIYWIDSTNQDKVEYYIN